MAALTLISLSLSVEHHGAYVDPKHYKGPQSFAGMRYVAEPSPHVLSVTGTDDGKKWWTVPGVCSGLGMAQITLNFSLKGGPASVAGNLVSDNGVTQIVWTDGNAWTQIKDPASLPKTKADLPDALSTDPLAKFDPLGVAKLEPHVFTQSAVAKPQPSTKSLLL
jgi:hypothetical protein